MPNFPLISVIIPVHNGEKYLQEAMKSVTAQTYPSIEIIIVDDGSSDSSETIAKQFQPAVRYFYQLHLGIAAALNLGIAQARGAFVALLDADDLWVENKLALQMSALNANPELDSAFGYVKQFISPELDQASKQKLSCPSDAMPGYLKGTMLIRKDMLMHIGPFESRWRVGEFIDWYARAIDSGLRSILVPEVVLLRRLHNTNLGIQEPDARTDFVRILKASLDRRKQRTQAKDASTDR